MTITSQQFNTLATKKDLKNDLKKIEQKMDEKFATKKDFEKFAIRAFDIFATKEDLKNLETKEEAKAAKNEILTAIDGVAKEQQDSRMERAANIGAHDRFEEKIIKVDKIDKRVGIIEKKLEIIPVAI